MPQPIENTTPLSVQRAFVVHVRAETASTVFAVRDSSSGVLASGLLTIPVRSNGPDPTSGAPRGDAWFVGFVSDATDIARVDFTEVDADGLNPDSNIGYDTLRFGAPPQPIPEPATVTLFGIGLAGLVAAQRRRKR